MLFASYRLCYYEDMVKKSSKGSKKLTADQHVKHRIIVGIGVIVIAVLAALVLALTFIPKVTTDARLHRINEIYNSIELPKNTYFNYENVFGDKRPYEYDAGRSRSSQKDFVVAKTVKETVAFMDKSIKDAGYTFFEEAYPGSTSVQYHYKTDRNEYIRVNVSSKTRDDAFSNSYLMNGKYSEEDFKIDPNAGPSNVTLKVNLDDNNE